MGSTLNIASSPLATVWRKNSVAWSQLTDPSDNEGVGSIWPIIGQAYVTLRNGPVGFVTAASSGSSITTWLPAAANFYLRMKNMYIASGNTGVKGVLWWQGETDAIAAMPQATYHGHLATIAAQVATDFGVKMFVCKLQNCSGIVPADLATINAAIVQGWGDIPNVAQGPDLSDIVTDDQYHLTSDAKIALAASRWWTAIRTQFGW